MEVIEFSRISNKVVINARLERAGFQQFSYHIQDDMINLVICYQPLLYDKFTSLHISFTDDMIIILF